MNFARDVVEAAPPDARALVELARDGTRREWTFAEVAAGARAAAAAFRQAGLRRGDVVLTLVGNRPEWVHAMVACFRLGLVALPCNEQLRAGDLRHRIAVAGPARGRLRPAQRRGARPRRAGTARCCGRRTRRARRRRPPIWRPTTRA